MDAHVSPPPPLPSHVGPAHGYSKGTCGPIILLLRHMGSSALLRALPWAAIAAGYTVTLHTQVACNSWPSFCGNGHPEWTADTAEFLFVHTYSYHAVLLASGFGLVFRLNQSLGRYWESRSAVQNMAAKWCDVLSMALAFDELPDTTGCQERECAPFARCVTHLCSLLHAVALHTLRGDLTLGTLSPYAAPLSPQRRGIRALFCGGRDALRRKRAAAAFSARNPIAVLGGVTAAERARLAASAERVHVVIGWLTRLLVRRRKSGGLSEAEPPVVSRVYQVLSDGTFWYLSALKLNAATCYVNLALLPVIVADKVASVALGAVISFFGVGFLFSLNEVARELEDPFSSELGVWMGINRLHVPLMQRHFDERCLALGACGVGELTDLLLADADAEGEEQLYADFLADAIGPTEESRAARKAAPREGGSAPV